MSETHERAIDLRHYARVLWRRKWYALIPPSLLLVTAVLTVPLLTPTYEVRSVVMYSERSRLAAPVEKFIMPTEGGSRGNEDTERDARILAIRLRSSGFLAGVVKGLHLDQDDGMRENADALLSRAAPGKTVDDVILDSKVAMLRGMLDVGALERGVYTVGVRGADPEFVYNVALALNEHLLSTVRQELFSEIKAASDFSREQMEIYKQMLEESQRALRDYEVRGAVGYTIPGAAAPSTDSRMILDLLAQTEGEIDRAAGEAASLRVRIQSERGSPAPKPVVHDTEAIRLIAERLKSFEKQLAWLLLENVWTAPAVVTQNERIAATRKELSSAIATAVDAEYGRLGAAERSALAELGFVETVVASLETRRESLRERAVVRPAPRVEAGSSPASRDADPDLIWLRQKVDTNREIYNSFLQQITSSRITEAVESTNLSRGFQVIEPPRWPDHPIAPNKLQILLAVVAAGVSLGIGLVFFVDYLDHSLKDVEEIERVLGLRIIGTIPRITSGPADDPRVALRRRAFVFGLVGVSLVLIVVFLTLRRPA